MSYGGLGTGAGAAGATVLAAAGFPAMGALALVTTAVLGGLMLLRWYGRHDSIG